MAKNLMIEKLTEEAFAEYGDILGIPENDPPTVSFGKRQNSYLNMVDLSGFESDRTTFGIVQGFHEELKLDQIERHFLSAEAFIPLEGVSVIVVAGPSDVNDPDAKPDLSKLRAFLLDGSKGIKFPVGTWHWPPMAITDEATFVLITDKDINDDINCVDIGEYNLQVV